MIPAGWVEHHRGDGELVGWIVPEGEGFQPRDILGRPITGEVLDWLEAEELLEATGLCFLAERWQLTLPDGTVRPVRIAEASARGIVVLADEYGAASAVGAKPERFELPFPAPVSLRRHEGR